MSRPPRLLSSTGVFRGINRQNIFEEETDFAEFKEMLIKVKCDMCKNRHVPNDYYEVVIL